MGFDPVDEPTVAIGGQTGLNPGAISDGNIAFADVRFIRGAFKVYASQSLIDAQDPAQFKDGQIVYAEHEKMLFRMDVTPGFTTFDPFTVHPATKSSASFNWPNSIISASVVGSTMTFTKGDNSTFDVNLPSGGSGSADTGSLITTASVAGNTMTFTKGDGDTFSVALPGGDSFPYTGSALITGSLGVTGSISTTGDISSSGALFISASESSTVDKVALYDNTTGQLFYTASSAIGGGGSGSSINATGSLADASPGGVVNTITITDFDADVVVRYDAGNLNFIFGIPTPPTPSINISGFITNKFNLELQTYTVTGNFGIGQYSLITGSLLSGSDVLELATGSEISLSRTFTGITGEIAEKTYSLQLTSSNPATTEIDKQLEQQTLSLNKLNAGSPTNTFVTTEVELGAASNKIEVGATGSIQFTGSKSSSDNNWTFVSMSATPGLDPFFTSANTSINANYNVRTSGIGDNITFTSTANYDSATLNNPVVYNNRSDSDTFSRIRSLRFGAFSESDTASIENSLSTGDLGAFQAGGTIYKGTINPNNQTVSISHTTGKVEYIITDDASSYTLSAIEVSGNNFIGTFQHSVAGGSPQIINGYRVYKSSTPLGAANPISYLLKT